MQREKSQKVTNFSWSHTYLFILHQFGSFRGQFLGVQKMVRKGQKGDKKDMKGVKKVSRIDQSRSQNCPVKPSKMARK